jgi:endoglucanase
MKAITPGIFLFFLFAKIQAQEVSFSVDFSSIASEGIYFLCHSACKTSSVKFQIENRAYDGKQEELLGFIRQQCCGYNPTLDMVCHQRDGRSFFGPMPDSTYVNASGGWHDAGRQNPLTVYHDATGDYSTNELTMEGTAGSILMMTYFTEDKRK